MRQRSNNLERCSHLPFRFIRNCETRISSIESRSRSGEAVNDSRRARSSASLSTSSSMASRPLGDEGEMLASETACS